MAVTSIWPIKGRVEDVIKYAKNPEKTTEENTEVLAALHAVDDVVEYAADEMKTEKMMFVSGVNCDSENAVEVFKNTIRDNLRSTRADAKRRVCFHGYQSFAEGEVDADTAHNIGVELAKRLWGEKFPVLVATHCNTNHYHNHFVICAVSDQDGSKFLNKKEDYRRMREESDRLCKEYGLSVIEHPKDKGMNYSEWRAEQEGVPTLRSSIRAAIDLAIKGSTSKKQFLDAMDEMGFIIDESGKYDDDLLEILSRVIALLNEQLCKDDYWIIDEKTLVNLGDSFDELWAYCENRYLTKKLNYLNNSD